jgi:hypothetical protein
LASCPASKDRAELGYEVVDVFEFAVDTGKADKCDLVESTQVLHDQITQDARFNFRFEVRIDLALNIGYQFVNQLVADRTLPTSTGETLADLFAAERFSAPVLFDHLDGHLFRTFVGRVPSAAIQATAPAAD